MCYWFGFEWSKNVISYHFLPSPVYSSLIYSFVVSFLKEEGLVFFNSFNFPIQHLNTQRLCFPLPPSSPWTFNISRFYLVASSYISLALTVYSNLAPFHTNKDVNFRWNASADKSGSAMWVPSQLLFWEGYCAICIIYLLQTCISFLTPCWLPCGQTRPRNSADISLLVFGSWNDRASHV